MEKRVFLFFILIIRIIIADTYPRELDIKDAKLSDVVAELSKYSKKTIICDNETQNEILNVYFKEGTSIKNILDTITLAYGLKEIKNKEIILLKRKNSPNETYLMGKVHKNTLGIGGVGVNLKRGDEHYYGRSGASGEFLIENIDEGVYYLSITSKSYSYLGDFIEVKKGQNRFDISLKSTFKRNISITEDSIQNNKKNVIIENISLENIDHMEVKRILKEIFQRDLGISSNGGNNSIILHGKPELVFQGKKLILSLDKKLKQVKIEAEVIDIKENTMKDLGINFNINTQGGLQDKNTGSSLGVLTESHIDGIGEVLGTTINFVSKFNSGESVLDFNLKALEAEQNLKVTALPSIIVLSGKEGVLRSTQEVIVGERKEENLDNDDVNYQPIFKEAGVILKVTPIPKSDGSIYLTLNLEVSDFNLKRTFKKDEEKENDGTFNAEGGSKELRSLKSEIRIKNRETIFIGGLKRTLDGTIHSEVPIVSDIPIVGNLFKSNSKRKENTILYIRLKAEIIEEN